MVNRTLAALALIFLLAASVHADNIATATQMMVRHSKRMHALHSVSANIAVEMPDGTHLAGYVKCLKPQYFRAELWFSRDGAKIDQGESVLHELWDCDGTTHYAVSADGTLSQGSGPVPDDDLSQDFFLLSDFLKLDFSGDGGLFTGSHVRIARTRWNGKSYQSISFTNPAMPSGAGQILVGDDGFVRALRVTDGGHEFGITLTNLCLNPPLTPSDFAFHKPAFAHVPKSKIDPEAKAILTKVEQTYRGLHSLTANAVEVTHGYIPKKKRAIYYGSDDTVKLMRPNYFWLDSYGLEFSKKSQRIERKHEMIVVSDGHALWRLWDFDKGYYEKDVPGDDGSKIIFFGATSLLSPFFSSDPGGIKTADQEADVKSVDYLGAARWRGDLYRIIRRVYNGEAELPVLMVTDYIGVDNLIHREDAYSEGPDGMNMDRDKFLTNLQVNPPLAASDFTFTLPKGATEKVEFPQSTQKLLANGVLAPNFTVHDRVGNPVSLADYRGKVVVLDFWATWCGPCQASLPSTNAAARRFRNQDVVVLGVNVWDTADAFKAWLPEHKDYDAIKFTIDPTPDSKDVATTLYNVSGIPTQYVIDRDGKIVWSTDGFSGSDDELVAAVKKALAVK